MTDATAESGSGAVANDVRGTSTPGDREAIPDATEASALEDSIVTKGNNSYYFAHKHKANGPKWDGKAEPKSLSKEDMKALNLEDPTKLLRESGRASSFAYHKSNITSYAFLNEEKHVKLYITLEGIGEQCTDDDIQLDWDESSLSLLIKNYSDSTITTEQDRSLSFGRLTAKISNAKYKLKTDKIIITLKKEKIGVDWHTINDKGSPDHELV
mmetsp:Transcript_921/g.2130  ORF Transcript_921/g.2130 Transcript_921/m.2130 type:complete len:213 (-) Transcript_921:279-917(-)|eukprot:CAMPEP_0168302122 /NCGR_PEP_ID=MMETSP0142_2-20121227/37680_1 /TAXON_ID=44445 /ORGANISM="Pseudo-nitzschia australis, Strain 10249 10 AB" /LENGTH=212 /DNA_ID=CAMNT_0008252611 /DNA_START=80 /DNA_END=718 /DNA_ORIENTATION=+